MTEKKIFELTRWWIIGLLAALTAVFFASPLQAGSEPDGWELLREADALLAGDRVLYFINDQQLEGLLQKVLADARDARAAKLEAATRLVFGRLRLSKGEVIGALSHFQMAHEHYKGAGDRAGEAEALQGIGEVYHTHGSHREAIPFLLDALALRRQEAAEPGTQASVLEALAESYAALGSYDEALSRLREAEKIRRSAEDPRTSLKAGLSLGEMEYRAGRYRDAVAALEVVAEEFSNLEVPAATDQEIAALYDQLFSNQESAYRHMGGWFGAYYAGEVGEGVSLQNVLPSGRQKLLPPGPPTTLQDEAFMERRQQNARDLFKARMRLEEAWEKFGPGARSPLVEVPGIGRRLKDECADLAGRRDPQTQQILARMRADLPGLKESCWNFAALRAGTWDCGDDFRYFSWISQQEGLPPAAPPECEALSRRSRPGRRPHPADSGFKVDREEGLEFAAQMRAAMQQYEESFHAMNWLSVGPFEGFQDAQKALYRKHAAAREAACHYELATRVYTSLGRANDQLGDYRHRQTQEAFAAGWEAAEKIWGGAALAGIGGVEPFRALATPGLPPPPFEGCDKLSRIPAVVPLLEGPPWRADISREKGELAMASALYASSLRATTQTGGVVEFLIAALSGLAETHRSQDMRAIAAVYYGKAIEVAESVHGELREEQIVSFFAGIQSPLYATMVDLLIDLGEEDLAFAYAEKARARAFLNLISRRPLDSDRRPLGQEWDDARREAVFPSLRLEHLRDGLVEEGTTLVAYFETPRRTLAWVVEAGKADLVELPLARSELSAVRDLRAAIAEKEVPTALAEKLYEGLFAPLRPYVRHPTLVLVPFGILHELPFAVLRDPSTGSYLIEDFDLTLLPSASALPYVQKRRNPWNGRALILGNPNGDLINAGPEAERVAELYGSTPRLGGEARERLVREEAAKIGVLHVAAHGRFDENDPLSGFLDLAGDDGEDPHDDGRLHGHEVLRDLRFPEANLVVLSACDSSVGMLSDGDDIASMSRAFLSAGAPSVVSTLWGVDDEASKALMIRFHQEFQSGVPVSEALRRAQVEVSADPETAAPYYWAGFTLTGDHLGRGETPQATRRFFAGLDEPESVDDTARQEPRSKPLNGRQQPLSSETAQQVAESLSGLAGIFEAVRRGGVTLFEHKAFAGEAEIFLADDPNLKDNDIGQDSATSVRVGSGCEVVLYQHIDYRGRSTVLTEDTENLRGTRVGNDEVSSLQVRCAD